MKRNRIYDGIMKGLNEVVNEVKTGKKELKRTTATLEILPLKKYSALEIKKIRNSAGMTQKMFASYLGVSVKTVEAWEAGINTPSGSSNRILNMFEMNKNLAIDYPFVIIK